MFAIAAVSVTSKISLDGSTEERSSSRSIIRSSSGSPTTDSPLRLIPTCGIGPIDSATSWIARATTQRSIAWIRPKRSAAGRNAPGAISFPRSPFIRSSSSPCLICPVASSRIGCRCRTKRSRSSASWIRWDQVSFAIARALRASGAV